MANGNGKKNDSIKKKKSKVKIIVTNKKGDTINVKKETKKLKEKLKKLKLRDILQGNKNRRNTRQRKREAKSSINPYNRVG
tara:strand:+ start:211 stop:453 length:243 start_codon:yes stop_codon:yes gene_type:complete